MGDVEPFGQRMTKYFVIPQRVILAIMGFLAILNAYTMRLTLSLAITKLVKRKNTTTDTSAHDYVCPPEKRTGELVYEGPFNWSEKLQGFILSSFYIGYIITHLPGGIIADKYGGKWVLGLGIFSTCLFTIISPWVINEFGAPGLITLRILMGVGEGTTFPALSVLIAHWVPLSERGKLGAFILGGGQVGTIINNSLSGMILHNFEWPVVFYFFGGLGMLWFLIFTAICYSTPEEHPCIKPKEKEYLARELTHLTNRKDLPPTPWKGIATNVPMYALVCAQIGHDWGFYIMVTYLPKYFDDVLQFSIKKNGFYSSFPFALMWILSIGSGFLGDYLVTSGRWTVTFLRKFMTGFAAIVPAIFIVLASYAGCHKMLVVVLFTICVGCMGPWYCGMKLSPFDMSPNYAGTLMGITNGIGAITGVFAPFSVGLMTPNATMMEWRLVFWVAFCVLTISAIIYCIWASGEVQPFNEPKPKEDKK